MNCPAFRATHPSVEGVFMSPLRRSSCILLLVALQPLSYQSRAAEQPPNLPGFLEAETIYWKDGAEGPIFNENRHFVISICKKLPEANASRNKLIEQLGANKQLDKVVFQWFGTNGANRLDIQVGKNVPVEVAQAVIAAYARDSKLPVFLHRVSQDGMFANTHRVFIGSLEAYGKAPLKREEIKVLLRPGL